MSKEFIPGKTKCYFCGTTYQGCPQIYTYKSAHSQPFIFCHSCRRTRYITKQQARLIAEKCDRPVIPVRSVSEARKHEESDILGESAHQLAKAGYAVTKLGAKAAYATTKFGITKVVPVLAKTAFGLVLLTARVAGKTVPVMAKAGARTVTGVQDGSVLRMPMYHYNGSAVISKNGFKPVGRVAERASVNNPKGKIVILEE